MSLSCIVRDVFVIPEGVVVGVEVGVVVAAVSLVTFSCNLF